MNKKTIPKHIHQIWIGDASKMPVAYMETWKMKGWKYTLWTEKEIAELKLENQELFDFYYSNQNWHGASDVVRIEVLNRIGGIYIDADTERILSIDDADFMDSQFFAVEANKPNGVPQGMERIANGVMGSITGHQILKTYIEMMKNAVIPTGVLPPWSTIGGSMLTRIVYAHKKQKEDGVKILMPHTFYPFDSSGNKSRTSGITYARHIWGTTHKKYGKI